MKGKLLLLCCLFYLTTSTTLNAQLFIDTSYTAEQMVMDFFDSDLVSVSNVTLQGGDLNMAYFEAANTDLGIPAGILLSSGNVFEAIGPNDTESESTNFGIPGSGLLDAILASSGLPGPTFDAIVLEMDIVSLIDTLDFSYVFGSEEYPEYVGSSFNDVFAFVVSGPNFPSYYNIAMVPGLPDPVSINTINESTNGQYYQPTLMGNLANEFEYDGFTTKLPAPFIVVPNETYHVQIAIADVSDAIFDSSVFLGIESLMGESNLKPPAEIGVEQNGSVVNFDNLSRYATSYLWDFGDNTTSTERYPGEHYYTSIGDYTVTLITQNYCCSDTASVNITVDAITDIEEIVVKPYELFPNPIQDQLQVKWSLGTDYTATMYDMAGRILWSVDQTTDLRSDLSGLDAGIYWLQLKTADQVFVERVVKQ